MKYALVTGASSGIGKAIAKKLAADGFRVLLNYRNNKDGAANTLTEIQTAGGSAELLPFDVSNLRETNQALEKWQNENKDAYIEVLVNNAGIRKDTLQVFMADDDWKDVIDTNLNSVFYVTRRVLKDMLIKKKGRIINIVSVSGLIGTPGQSNYSAAKAGVIGATRSLAREIAAKKITVNAVAPGFIRTAMTEELDENLLKKQIPLKRFGTPEEVAELVSFLASEKSAYITGQIISIDGGITS